LTAGQLGSRICIAGIAALAFAALAPPAAQADIDTFTVDSFVDANDNNIGNNLCATGGAVCTLRAAVQETNDNDGPGETDVVNFAAPIVGTTIQLTAVLETIDEPLSINGCSTAPNNPAPCVGVRGLNTSTDAFFLAGGATGVTFRGLAFSNVDRAIAALSGTANLTVKNNWFGIKVDGTDEATRMGVQVSDDGAVIGGPAGATGISPADRNVFANATVGEAVGLDIFAGDDAVVQGNWFGTNETGTAAAANGQDIVLGGSSTDTATDTTIGGTQPSPGTCSGPCNVISGATTDGIDLRDVHPQDAADTRITGNFIGLDPTGTVGIPNTLNGIRTANAPGTVIGGSAGEGNYIAGGGQAISALFQGAPGLEITGNRIGTNAAGTAPLSPPANYGMLVMSDATDPAEITLNTIATAPGAVDAIQIMGEGALIGGNLLGVGPGGQTLGAGSQGIRTVSLQDAVITGNTIGDFTSHGVTLEGSDGNTVVDNLIGVDGASGDHGNGADGVRITDFLTDAATGNTIGGTLLVQQNLISNNGGDAIGIVGDGNDDNQILRNRGGPNGTDPEDLFIDLVGTDGSGNGATGPNGGIEAPDLQAATASRSVGVGIPGASVAAFGNSDGEFSSLNGFHGLATADSRGLWVITHTAPVPVGQGLAHDQSTASDGTSELSIVGSGFLDPPDASAPGAAISSGPNGPTADSTPSFTLDDPTSDPNFQIFLCATDAGLYQPCGIDGSVYTTAPLADGAHSITIVGIDEAANLSSTLTRSFSVDTTPPSTTITKAPKAKVTLKKKKVSVSFSFVSGEPGQGGFQCQLDNAEFTLCDSGSFSAKVKKGSHAFRVRAYDALGNPDPTLEVRSFKVVKKKKKKKKK
jgi:CSLREA domain-containing protein